MLKALWGRITGADKKLTIPDQQCRSLGRIGDYTVIYPYGLYCDLPDDVLVAEIGKRAVMGMTIDRPDDFDRGEPVLFHPVNKTRIILRNNGDVDVITNGDFNIDASGDFNVTCNKATITTIDISSSSFTHNGTVIGDKHIHSQGNDSDGDSEVDTGYPHS